MKDIKINDVAYFCSPALGGSVLKVVVKKLNSLTFKNNSEDNEESVFESPLFYVENLETIIPVKNPNLGEREHDSDGCFDIVPQYLYKTLDEAINAYNEEINEQLDYLENKLNNQQKILDLIDKQNFTESNSKAETTVINVYGQNIKTLKDITEQYYSFDQHYLERLIEFDKVLSGEKPLIFKGYPMNGNLDPETSEINFEFSMEDCVDIYNSTKKAFFWGSFSVEGLDFIYNDFESAIQGFKIKLKEHIEKLSHEIKFLKTLKN